MIAFALVVVGLAASYHAARERSFSLSTSLVAVATVAGGSFVAWQMQSGAIRPAAMMALASIVWAIAQHVTRNRRSWPVTAATVIACLLIATPGLGAPSGWRTAEVANVLWSSRGGLLSTSVVIYLGVIGLAMAWRTDRHLFVAGLGLLVALAGLVGARDRWWVSAYPSAPAFAVLTPFLVSGIAVFFERLSQTVAKRPGLATGSALTTLVLWNATLVDVAHAGKLRIGEPVSFGNLAADQARTLHDWVGHPGSYPANLIFAVRNGVSAGRYDLFQPLGLLGNGRAEGTVDVGGDDAAMLGDGWHAPEREGDLSFRWATATAELTVPFDRVGDVVVRIHARPFEVPGASPQQLTLVINGRPQAPVVLPSAWSDVEVPVSSAMWRTGVNRVGLRFARQARPLDAGAADSRWLAAAIDRLTFTLRP